MLYIIAYLPVTSQFPQMSTAQTIPLWPCNSVTSKVFFFHAFLSLSSGNRSVAVKFKRIHSFYKYYCNINISTDVTCDFWHKYEQALQFNLKNQDYSKLSETH